MAKITLATNLVLNADGAWIMLDETEGREMTLLVAGTFGGATATLQVRDSAGQVIAVPRGAFAAAGAENIRLHAVDVRISNAGGDGTTAVDAELVW